MKKQLSLLVLLCALAAGLHSQSIDGSWKGLLSAGPSKLNLVFHFAHDDGGRPTCLMDSPDQGAQGLPAVVQYLQGDSVSVAFPALGATYCGRLREGRIEGHFTQLGMSLPLTLQPGSVELRRPQTPRPPYPYEMQEVAFPNGTDGNTLCGTLTLPVGYDGSRPATAILLVTGSGQQNRDEELFGHKPFLVLADYLARNGIATLRCDDRGVGCSTGKAEGRTTLDNMADALAGLNYLESTQRFARIGVLGHSEGGLIAFMLASRHPGKVGFVVSLAGNAVRGDSILLEQNRMGLRASGVPPTLCDDYCRALRAVLDYRRAGLPVTDAAFLADSLATAVGAQLPPEAVGNLSHCLAERNAWLDYFIAYDPADDIAATRCPVLALNGSLDCQVAAAPNLAVLRRLLPPDSRTVVREYPGLNHLFQHCTTGNVSEYGSIEETLSPEVLAAIAAWVNGL